MNNMMRNNMMMNNMMMNNGKNENLEAQCNYFPVNKIGENMNENNVSKNNNNNYNNNNDNNYNNVNNDNKYNNNDYNNNDYNNNEDMNEYFKNSPMVRKNIIETIDKEKLKKLVLSCKKRTEINLNQFLVDFKDVTKNLTSSEKAFALFYWMCENIEYDVEGYFSGNMDVNPESVYRNGYGVCSGYSRLFRHIGTYIGINVICISGFAKGVGFEIGTKISGTNHEWNIIKLYHLYYQIDSTWGAGNLNGRVFQKRYSEFYFCPNPEDFFASHFPEDPKWQLITPSLSVEEFAKRIKFYSHFYDLFTKSDSLYHTINVKNKTIIRFYKKKEKVAFLINLNDAEDNNTEDVKYLLKDQKDYVDLIFIFKHKGKYSANIFANDGSNSSYDAMSKYYFESEKEWGDKKFDFSMDDYDIMDKLHLESLSHKDFEFKANNREKLYFKFKPDSKIYIRRVNLSFEDEYDNIKRVTKYYMKDNNLEVEVIFNKKGKYKLSIDYFDLSLNDDNLIMESLANYPIVSTNAKQNQVFTQEELLIHQPFEESLNHIKLKYQSHKSQNIAAKRIEKFEFEAEDNNIKINQYVYPENSKVLTKKEKENNKFIFYFGFNEKKNSF